MRESNLFRKYELDNLPTNRDCFLVDERHIGEFEDRWLSINNGGEGWQESYLVTLAAVRRSDDLGASLSCYFDNVRRRHEVAVSLPRDSFVACVECSGYDCKPHIFVKSGWIRQLYARFYSIFCYVDFIGTKRKLHSGSLGQKELHALRDVIDGFAKNHPSICIVSFADSLWMKSSWVSGDFLRSVESTYCPEKMLFALNDLAGLCMKLHKMAFYSILAQGSNEYCSESGMHTSSSGNHVCMNCLGPPFALAFDIDKAARELDEQERREVYMDNLFFMSLRMDAQCRQRFARHEYESAMLGDGKGSYWTGNRQEFLGCLN
jgi:hypothetical protein